MRRSMKKEWPNIAGWRFDRIARTEALIGVNSGSFETLSRNGVTTIEWQAHLDHRTRPSHREMDGYAVKVGDPFPNGCRYPGDPDAQIREIVNCRCVLAPVNPDLVAPDRLWTGGEMPAVTGPGDMYDNLFDYSLVNDGATFNPRLGRYYTGPGYGVAQHQGTFASVSVNDREAFKRAISDLRHKYPDAYVGTWVHDGMIDIDPSLVVRDRADAVKQAIERNQQAIWDFTKCEEIPTGGTGR
jgi:SPP1 gp7 family putative phage head morphogenesis protein